MDFPVDEQANLQLVGDIDTSENYNLKHADSVNSIPPPPPPVGLVVPVASEESCDITEAERLKLQDNEQQEQKQQLLQQTAEPQGRSDNCCEKFLKCLGLIPCPSLLSWIILFLGLGCLSGSLLVATWRTRGLLKNGNLLWFMEYTIIGVVSAMFLMGIVFLTTGHLSSEPTSRRLFNSFTKNRCAQGLNIFILATAYFLTLCWIFVTAILTVPLVLIINVFIVDPSILDPKLYGFTGDPYSGTELEIFKQDAKELLICYVVSFFAAVLVVLSLICFIICITANITHLRDNRFATLNAYGSEEVQNSKHSVQDTNM